MNARRASQCLRPPSQINDHAACRNPCKRRRGPPALSAVPAPAATEEESVDFFDGLPDDLVVSVLSGLSSSADRPSDLISALSTCKRFHVLGHRPPVLSKAGAGCVAVRARSWCDSAHRFLKRCVDCGNLEASYVLGMIRFYALENRGSGAALMARAAIGSHAAALYSLAIIQFNGSGGSKTEKDLQAGVALCARAAFLGHVDAIRELGHCLQDGYGVRRNVTEGRRFLIQANARELAAAVSSYPAWQEQRRRQATAAAGATSPGCCPLLSDYGWSLPAPEPHPANQFLAEWFGARAGEGPRLCSHRGCCRPETRRHEFRRCSVCGLVNYCSRACQALHWKLSHKSECSPTHGWPAVEGGAATH
ncbi:serine threonine-protein kinase RIO1 [Musa troglodytarum]|uniref:Serine threonine-protein kinase RIO1 n=1 Tax=Musa troglodytarum TaxID=320322 RepID=A0A9E7HUM8_9LILI|nr:serine threonine-protein kinase RIO1 [Musa troglodytarum]